MKENELNGALRTAALDYIAPLLAEHYETDVLVTSAYERAIPVVDADGNEKYIVIKISVPRGTRNGNGGYNPYDGYAVAEAYREEVESAAAEKKAAAERTEMEKKAKAAARAKRGKKVEE